MAFLSPLYIKKFETGLVQNRPNFILPDDAFPVIENMLIFREVLKKKPGYRLLGRLKRSQTSVALGVSLSGAGAISNNIKTLLGLETDADIELGSLSITDGTNTYTETGTGILTGAPGGTGTINYSTMAFTISGGAAAGPLTATFNYHPSLPVMGLRSNELNAVSAEETIAFDTTYAYQYNNGWDEWIPGTTWTGTDSDFFFTTNYWVDGADRKIFWVTNNTGATGS